MRIVFEESEGELFFEVIVCPHEIEQLTDRLGVANEFAIDFGGFKLLNVYLRKENLCHLLKAKPLRRKRGSKGT